jgi:hypothetical protein
MSYTMEGIVAASPDFGIVPAALLSIFVFQYFPAYQVRVSLSVRLLDVVVVSGGLSKDGTCVRVCVFGFARASNAPVDCLHGARRGNTYKEQGAATRIN